jgi:nucleoside-diphosphate-sugar epimerase
VRCLDRLLYGNANSVMAFAGDGNYEFLNGDLVDAAAVEQALADVTDVVILAALVGDPITREYPDAARAINLDGTLALLDGLDGKGLNKVIFLSTCSNYGLIEGDETAHEDFALNPLSLYAEAKVAVERDLLARRGATDYHATALRCATAFGLSPRMRFDLTVAEFVHEMFLGRELVVYDADTWRPYCHVADFAELIRRVLEAPVDKVDFQVFNAGGDANNLTKRSLVDEILQHLPAATVRYQEHGLDPRNYRVDFARVRETLLFEPVYGVSDGIRELLSALRQRLFDGVDAAPQFYGNRTIQYP